MNFAITTITTLLSIDFAITTITRAPINVVSRVFMALLYTNFCAIRSINFVITRESIAAQQLPEQACLSLHGFTQSHGNGRAGLDMRGLPLSSENFSSPQRRSMQSDQSYVALLLPIIRPSLLHHHRQLHPLLPILRTRLRGGSGGDGGGDDDDGDCRGRRLCTRLLHLGVMTRMFVSAGASLRTGLQRRHTHKQGN